MSEAVACLAGDALESAAAGLAGAVPSSFGWATPIHDVQCRELDNSVAVVKLVESSNWWIKTARSEDNELATAYPVWPPPPYALAQAVSCCSELPGWAALGNSVTTQYDAAGNTATVTNERGYNTQYGYDADNRLTLTTEAAGTSVQRLTTTVYDAVGNVTAQTDGINTMTYSYRGFAATKERNRTALSNLRMLVCVNRKEQRRASVASRHPPKTSFGRSWKHPGSL